jgi:hypothetical protein
MLELLDTPGDVLAVKIAHNITGEDLVRHISYRTYMPNERGEALAWVVGS